MAKWREESGKTIKSAETEPEPEPATEPNDTPRTTRRRSGRRARDGNGLRTGVRHVSSRTTNLVRVLAMIICVLLALHIAFVNNTTKQDNTNNRTANDWADWFAWRFRD